MKNKLLSVKNLSVLFDTPNGFISAVDNISFDLEKNQKLVIIGESGSGKTVLLSSICGILKGEPGITSGEIYYNSENLLKEIDKTVKVRCDKDFVSIKKNEYKYIKILGNIRNKLRGEVSVIFQDPRKALDPLYTIKQQMIEAVNFFLMKENKNMEFVQKEKYAVEWLEKVNINEPEKVLEQYPNELSGGMLQRVMIAISMIIKPKILIADEPTTALDTTTAALIFDLFIKVFEENDISLIFVTHDVALAEKIADKVLIMNSGKIVEKGTSQNVFNNHYKHPYTEALLKARLNPISTDLKTPVFFLKDKSSDELYIQSGCKFRLRCPIATEECAVEVNYEKFAPEHCILCRNLEN